MLPKKQLCVRACILGLSPPSLWMDILLGVHIPGSPGTLQGEFWMGISSVLNDAEVFKELVVSVFHLVFPF